MTPIDRSRRGPRPTIRRSAAHLAFCLALAVIMAPAIDTTIGCATAQTTSPAPQATPPQTPRAGPASGGAATSDQNSTTTPPLAQVEERAAHGDATPAAAHSGAGTLEIWGIIAIFAVVAVVGWLVVRRPRSTELSGPSGGRTRDPKSGGGPGAQNR